MSDNRISNGGREEQIRNGGREEQIGNGGREEQINSAKAPGDTRAEQDRTPSIRARIVARVRSAKLDAMLAVGVPAPAGSALAVRAARLTSVAEREAIARTLRHVVREAERQQDCGLLVTARIPLHHKNIAAAVDVIDKITLRLHAPLPVSARGMARLNRILTDGCGPLYELGRGDLAGRLGAALAEL
ncbi:hypothetical protein MMAG44476_26084 [Mycolicibacterium mageritense DSM 44476 = CIP 104973]|nr:hypothetical protein [Mycolicibacterium mageritense]MCC9179575.1 hypothetical protein [Mycolicibacterium mageritense]CDO25970.1 hypothetical protein BN978_06519 [Mycolicibacterium mageritense DSM 44476 = CIP 104973]